MQVRAGTGKVSTANSKPTRDQETTDESSEQKHSMSLGQQSQTFPIAKEKTDCYKREEKKKKKITERLRKQNFLTVRTQQ